MSENHYSQRDEQEHIVEFFKDLPAGRFLDIGANDGIGFSNVRRLFELGWGGVMAEVAAGPFHKLMSNYKDAPNVTLVHAAICATARAWIDFAMNDDFTSTSSKSHEDKWKEASPYQHVWAVGVPWCDLVMQFPGPYDMINLDIEGENWPLFEQIMITDVAGLKLICVEFDDKREQMLAAAQIRGFKLLHETSENLILVR